MNANLLPDEVADAVLGVSLPLLLTLLVLLAVAFVLTAGTCLLPHPPPPHPRSLACSWTIDTM